MSNRSLHLLEIRPNRLNTQTKSNDENNIGNGNIARKYTVNGIDSNRRTRTTASATTTVPTSAIVVAMSSTETLLLSSSGDVLSSRCRPTETNEDDDFFGKDVALMCCEIDLDDDLSTHLQDSATICSPWRNNVKVMSRKVKSNRDGGVSVGVGGGLRGGAPSVAHWSQESTSTSETRPQHNLTKKFQSPPIPAAGFDEDSIVPIRSFDYNTNDGEALYGYSAAADRNSTPYLAQSRNNYSPKNNMYKMTTIPEPRVPPDDSDEVDGANYGIPTFLPSFVQVKITQISAHPLGGHVLLISDAGLLYSYGSNKYGQLGIGAKSNTPVRTPHIVTPLVEHGGKATLCAAGVSHSLVVVMTEERRLSKSQSFENTSQFNASSSCMYHHQLYGFGRNDFTKIGLVSPKLANDGELDEMENVVMPRRVALRAKVVTSLDGIVALSASEEHSAALVNRPNGDVELYTWGNAMYGALGLPQPSATHQGALRLVPIPSFVASLSRTSNPQAQTKSILWNDKNECPQHISLGQRSSYITTSLGRSFIFGTDENGLLGLGQERKEVWEPTELCIPESIQSISAGLKHVVALAKSSGNLYAWGDLRNAGVDDSETHWLPKRVEVHQRHRVIQVHAGSNCSVLVDESGYVYSGGLSTERLGQGYDDNDDVPSVIPMSQMFGGFRLWQLEPKMQKVKPILHRGMTAEV